MYGVAIEASSGPDCVAQVQQAEAAGVPAAWATMARTSRSRILE